MRFVIGILTSEGLRLKEEDSVVSDGESTEAAQQLRATSQPIRRNDVKRKAVSFQHQFHKLHHPLLLSRPDHYFRDEFFNINRHANPFAPR